MKTIHTRWARIALIMAIGGLIGVQDALAQPRAGGPPEGRERNGEWRGDPERRERYREDRGDPETAHPHVERWLERLRERDPAEHERLTQLRETHPAAFRVELRRRLHESRVLDRIREENPRFHAYMSGLTREERDELGNLLHQITEDAPMRPARHRRALLPDMAQEGEGQEWVRQWREAKDEEAKGAVRSGLRAHLKTVFDQRTAEQEEELRQAEEQLTHLRDIIQKRQENREEWIDRLMNRLLQERPDRERPERDRPPRSRDREE